jgi:hypothetical protein
MILTNSQKTTLAVILDEEVQSQVEDPTMPWALDDARELRAALDRGDKLGAWPLARILCEEVALRSNELQDRVMLEDHAEVCHHAARVAAAADILALLHRS